MKKNIDMKKIVSYVETILNKSIKDIYDDDLLAITTLPLFYIENGDDDTAFDINYICSTFINLNKIIFNNFNITNDFMKALSFLNLECLEFYNCEFDDIDYKCNISKLVINKSKVKDFKFISNFTELNYFEVSNPVNLSFDLSCLNNNKKLEKLKVNGCRVINSDEFSVNGFIKSLIVVDCEFTKDAIDYINSLPLLNELFIDSEYIELVEPREGCIIKDDLCSLMIDYEIDLKDNE